MLPLPTLGLRRSVNKHNSELHILADWAEASVLFGEPRLARADIEEALVAEGAYDDPDFCAEFIESVWGALKERRVLQGKPYPISIHRLRLQADLHWTDVPYFAFCSMVGFGRVYEKFAAKGLGPDYTVQGGLFERVVSHRLKVLFPTWSVIRTGWSADQRSLLQNAAPQLCSRLGLVFRGTQPWVSEAAKESGLDVVVSRDFKDGLVGRPIFLGQCASGANWQGKRTEPNLDVWTEMVQFVNQPQRLFATPYALNETEMLQSAKLVQGVVLDRTRLLGEHDAPRPLSLDEDIVVWVLRCMAKLHKHLNGQ